MVHEPTMVNKDNKGSIAWASESMASQFAKRKHVDIRYFCVIVVVTAGNTEPRKGNTEMVVSHIRQNYSSCLTLRFKHKNTTKVTMNGYSD